VREQEDTIQLFAAAKFLLLERKKHEMHVYVHNVQCMSPLILYNQTYIFDERDHFLELFCTRNKWTVGL